MKQERLKRQQEALSNNYDSQGKAALGAGTYLTNTVGDAETFTDDDENEDEEGTSESDDGEFS